MTNVAYVLTYLSKITNFKGCINTLKTLGVIFNSFKTNKVVLSPVKKCLHESKTQYEIE